MSKETSEDGYGQAAGAIGSLAIGFGVMAAIRDWLGLSWPATVALVAGLLVLLGYGAWRSRKLIARLRAGFAGAAPQTQATSPADQAEEEAQDAGAHPELTAALRTAGIIGKDEIIRAEDTEIRSSAFGKEYEFLLPSGGKFENVEKNLDSLAGVLGVTRLHLKLTRSRDTELRVKLLKLHQPPFSRPFPMPTREEIKSFPGVALGHDVTGQITGVKTFRKASMLVAGMTQTGKTTFINGLLACLLIAYEEFDLYLLDGKFCGLTRFEKRAARYESSDDPQVFESIVDELNERSDVRYKKITEAVRKRQAAPKFKPVIFVVDEAADFFASDESKEGKEQARRIAEKTRTLVSKSLESEISTILLTQRPSTNAIPVMVRDQFLYRVSLYVASSGTARVALGDTYFETVAPINPALLDPDIQGQAVLFAHGRSTLLRGFFFPDDFIWSVVDEGAPVPENPAPAPSVPVLEELPPLEKVIAAMEEEGADFMSYADVAGVLGIEEENSTKRSSLIAKKLGGKVPTGRRATARGYHLEDLRAALRTAH